MAGDGDASAILKQANQTLQNEFGGCLLILQIEADCLDKQQAKALDFLNSLTTMQNVERHSHSEH